MKEGDKVGLRKYRKYTCDPTVLMLRPETPRLPQIKIGQYYKTKILAGKGRVKK